jgi:hypothetical protein
MTPTKRGRPPKFSEPGRPITVTLPQSTLDRLAAIDSDRGRAIVKAAEMAFPSEEGWDGLPQLVEVAPGVCVILVGPSRYLQEIAWLRLLEMAPSRFLLIIPSGTSIDSLELAVIDRLEEVGANEQREAAILQGLRSLIGTLRRGCELSKAELLLIQKK